MTNQKQFQEYLSRCIKDYSDFLEKIEEEKRKRKIGNLVEIVSVPIMLNIESKPISEYLEKYGKLDKRNPLLRKEAILLYEDDEKESISSCIDTICGIYRWTWTKNHYFLVAPEKSDIEKLKKDRSYYRESAKRIIINTSQLKNDKLRINYSEEDFIWFGDLIPYLSGKTDKKTIDFLKNLFEVCQNEVAIKNRLNGKSFIWRGGSARSCFDDLERNLMKES